jgi:hypothetical protein
MKERVMSGLQHSSIKNEKITAMQGKIEIYGLFFSGVDPR